MSGIDVLLGVVFAVMSAAVVVDRRLATAGAPPAPAPVAGPALPDPVLRIETGSFGLPQLGALAEGWALMGPSGTLVATNLPERAALLAGACAVLRLAGDAADDAALRPWHTVTLEGPRGFLLGEMSPRGAVLAVLARADADRGDIRRGMSDALGEVERRWEELLPGVSRSLPEPAPPPDLDAEAEAFSPFTPLD